MAQYTVYVYTFAAFDGISSYGNIMNSSFTYNGLAPTAIVVDDADNLLNDNNPSVGGALATIVPGQGGGLFNDGDVMNLAGSLFTVPAEGSGEGLYAINVNGSYPGDYFISTFPLTTGTTYATGTLDGVASQNFAPTYADLFAPCFTRSTSIRTQTGERPIEDLTAGDMVLTMDHGYQPIRWIGSSKRPATGDLAPILIRKGALGNDRDLRVSPQHRMLLQSWQAELLFGETEVLATAKSLVNDHSIIRVEGGEVEYFHILFDTHEIIWAEGAPSESFHPGEQGWKALDEPTRNEILGLFPELSDGDFSNYGPSARVSLKHKEGQLLGQYMLPENQANEGNPNA